MAVQCTSDCSHSKDRAPTSFTNPNRVKTAHVAPASRGPGSKTATRYSQITLLGEKGRMLWGGGEGDDVFNVFRSARVLFRLFGVYALLIAN